LGSEKREKRAKEAQGQHASHLVSNRKSRRRQMREEEEEEIETHRNILENPLYHSETPRISLKISSSLSPLQQRRVPVLEPFQHNLSLLRKPPLQIFQHDTSSLEFPFSCHHDQRLRERVLVRRRPCWRGGVEEADDLELVGVRRGVRGDTERSKKRGEGFVVPGVGGRTSFSGDVDVKVEPKSFLGSSSRARRKSTGGNESSTSISSFLPFPPTVTILHLPRFLLFSQTSYSPSATHPSTLRPRRLPTSLRIRRSPSTSEQKQLDP